MRVKQKVSAGAMQWHHLDLRVELEATLPTSLLYGQNRRGQEETLLWFRGEQDPLHPFLQKLLSIQIPPRAYSINMRGIDLLAPSATRSLLLMAEGVRRQTAAPILFVGVGQEVLLGLQGMHASLPTSSAFWAMDEACNPHIIGALPDRLQAIVDALQARGEICAADLAAEWSEDRSRKATNRFSVYLQELAATGLAIREKVPASQEGTRKRGWTYRYRLVYPLWKM